MGLRILSQPSDPDAVARDLARAIEETLSEARVEVAATGPGHFEIRVVAPEFEGMPLVRQQQRVYGAIAHLMSGDAPPVHAIDRLVTRAA